MLIGFVQFILASPGGRQVHWGSLGSFGRNLVVVGLILVHCSAHRGRWVHSGAPMCHSRAPWGRWISLRYFGQAQEVVGFIQVRWVHSCAPKTDVGFICDGWVHSGKS